jgi:hypothetical protein
MMFSPIVHNLSKQNYEVTKKNHLKKQENKFT